MSEEKRYAQISNESVQVWAETNGITELSAETLRSIASDATYRLRKVLEISNLFLRHSKRQKLTTDDFNRTLKWMDVPPVHGYSGSEAVDYVNIPDLGVHVLHDPPVNLSSTALSGDIFHQPGSPYVQAEWAHVSSHVVLKSENNAEEKVLSPLPLNPELSKYYQSLFSVITRPSNTLFKIICDDVGKSPNLGPLVGPIVGGVLKGAQKARQKPLILRRLLLIIRALLFNPFLHLGPQNYIRDIVNVLVFCVVTERKSPHDTQSIRTLAANILLMLSHKEAVGAAYELAVISLSSVVASSSRPWTQHAGALTGLLTLGHHALHSALLPIVKQYHERLNHILSQTPSLTLSSAIVAKDTLDANVTSSLFLGGFINIVVSFIKKLPNKQKIYIQRRSKIDFNTQDENKRNESDSQDEEYIELINKIHESYFLGEEMYGPAFVLQVPTVYLQIGKERIPRFLRSSVYQEHSKSDETLLLEFTNPTPAKRPRTSSSRSLPSQYSSNSPKERKHVLCSQMFDNYRLIEPLNKRRIYMCVRGCSTRNFEYLKQKKSSLPLFVEHQYRILLSNNSKKRPTGKMPHCTFSRPIYHPKRPSYSLNYLVL